MREELHCQCETFTGTEQQRNAQVHEENLQIEKTASVNSKEAVSDLRTIYHMVVYYGGLGSPYHILSPRLCANHRSTGNFSTLLLVAA